MEPRSVPLVVRHGRPTVDLGVVDAAGRPGTVRALVDSGGGALMLTQVVAERLGLAAGHGVDAGGGVLTTVEPPALDVDGYALDTDGVPAYAVGEGMATGVEGEGIDLVLPAGVLRRHAVVIDNPGGSFTAGPPGSIAARGVPLPVEVHAESGLMLVDAEVAGTRLRLLLDTGPACSLVADRIFRQWLHEHGDWPTSAASVGPANMAGIPFEASAPMLRAPELRWGSFTVPAVAFAWRPDDALGALGPGTTAEVDGTLAGNVLQHFRVHLDPADDVVRVEQGRPFVGHDADMVGVVVGFDAEQGYSVLGTITGLDEVHVGDRLLAVDGEPLAPLHLGEVVDRLRGTPAETVRHLTLERDGEVTEAEAPVLRVV